MRCHHFHSIHSRTILSGVTGRDRLELTNSFKGSWALVWADRWHG
jgi:hypothetical protein